MRSTPLTAFLLAALPAQAGASPLTLSSAIERALAGHANVRIARLRQDEASNKRASATGALLPRLRAEAGVQWWDRATRVSFGSGAPPPDTTGLPPAFADMIAQSSQPSTVRERLTGTVSLSAVQPLTGLYPLWTARTLESRGLEAAAAGITRARHDLTIEVIDTYAQCLTAEAALGIAKKGIELADSLLSRTESLVQAGMARPAERLRARVYLFQAKEAAISAESGVELSRAALSTLVGIKPEEAFALVPPLPRTLALPTLEQAMQQAKEHRPELIEARARLGQAEQAVHLSRSRLVPELAAIARYEHSEGSKFSMKDSFFVGGQLGWDFWEWGSKWFLIDATKAQAQAAALEVEKAEDGLMLAVRQALTQVAIAAERRQAAEAGIDAARELLSTEEARYSAGATTATDRMQAQSSFLQAEFSLVSSRFNELVAQAKLDQALGRDPGF